MHASLIIEDDYLSFLQTEKILKRIGFTKIDNVSTVKDIPKYLKSNNYDLIISDIILEHGQLSWPYFKSNPTQIPIIFTTVLDDSELFNDIQSQQNSLFLVKPINDLTLESAVLTMMANYTKTNIIKPELKGNDIQRLNNSIFVRNNGKIIKINPDNIQFIKSEGNYCYLNLELKKFVIRSSIKKVLMSINNPNFVQVQRSYVVNLTHFEKLTIHDNFINIGTNQIPIGRKYKKDLITLIKSNY